LSKKPIADAWFDSRFSVIVAATYISEVACMINNARTQLKSLPGKMPSFLNVMVVGLLAGLSFGVHFGVVPVLNHLDAPGYITAMQGLTPAFSHAVVPLMCMGLGTFLVRLLWLRSPCRGMNFWTLISFGFFLAAAWITLRGHWPINHQVTHWPPQNPPADWEGVRQEWNRLNFWRFAAAQLGFLALLIPFVFGLNQRRHAGVPS
jgi:hypothetical protein